MIRQQATLSILFARLHASERLPFYAKLGCFDLLLGPFEKGGLLQNARNNF